MGGRVKTEEEYSYTCESFGRIDFIEYE